ncbi:SUMF1/EgtB/PvdO family nonheme iron enzyme [Glaciecola sp. MH2013]|uniref:bifunctional serine/threonine-protein kinase/formylglycine-generating enzyme family protein n=1 Tax=Glaciecola sp. MH2013 TaxID=2785524 RepID=UPI00189D6E6A|nr:bifunctional serine/threonine-protein kinase/formylglycine-generating enzyme family protein [Glaciecola sp. MH2013]MBF7073068.1 SUMF1/EgtB/PvdO family nonheme iron enzyme [Glaciecola sp. MH2013]
MNTIGKYRVLGLIDRGGSASVYLAQDPLLDVQVAVKVFTGSTTNFLSEAKLLHGLASSPNIINFMSYGFVDDDQAQPYLVMPYYKRSLATLLGEDNKLSVTKSLSIALQLLKGLACIHRAGILHLDLKPANILLDDNDEVQIIDFGISVNSDTKTQNDSRTSNSYLSYTHYNLAGTPAYASPEQMLGKTNLSVHSDFYSLGQILFRCLFGRLPCRPKAHDSEQSTSTAHEKIYYLLRSLLAAAPEHRPHNALQIQGLIEQVLSDLSSSREYQSQNQKIDASEIDDAFSDNTNDEQAIKNRASYHATTQQWSAASSPETESLSAIKNDIIALLVSEAEVDEKNFQRLSLQAKAVLHENYDEAGFIQFIERVTRQLKKERPDFARFSLWIEQVDQAIIAANGPLDGQHKARLLELGNAVLSQPSHLEEKIAARENLVFCHTNQAKTHQAKIKTTSLLSWRYFFRFCAVMGGVLLAALIPNIVEFSKPRVTPSTANTSSANNQEAIHTNQIDTHQSDKTMRIESSLPAQVVQVRLNVQPADAVVSFQSLSGDEVLSGQLTEGDYILRLSRNGFTTIKKKVSLRLPSFNINATLSLSDSRYFIGNSDPRVADGIPVEFILLPKIPDSQKRIRMMSTEVSNSLYMACVAAGKCATSSRVSTDQRAVIFSRPNHPVVNVSWYDIQEKFIPWLSSITGTELRLPTEKEWIFATRSVNGNGDNSNLALSKTRSMGHCKDCISTSSFAGQYARTTAPVRSFAANQWQLYDLQGNVQEWMQDCGKAASQTLAPRCDQAVVKGGSWFDNAATMSPEHYQVLKKTVRSHTTGFRLVEIVHHQGPT